ncbi:MAG: transposase family protein [Desulfovibrio sp.]|uniref:DDE-type integrase/transposase/recombinase n=1 Tax=Desulfovibrio sp. TaxID=885 RepID=UPI001A687506|nr:DDE-type integrase/transposase/recombinase [Desulfovibrio sp.]MBD5416138.1 transposase family protein [Desulfovibrio sp.]
MTVDEIALLPTLCRSTVFRALRKLGFSRLSPFELKPKVQYYEWASPGDMLHLDINCLGKIDGIGHRKDGTRQVKRRKPGWEYLHVCEDNAPQVAYTAIHADETEKPAIEFLWFAVTWYKQHGIKVKRVLTDNRACYKSRKFRQTRGIQHKRIKSYHPQTNGKSERFIRTALKE